jgi:hypothetical protein
MPTILIVQRDLAYAHALAARLEKAGYRTLLCTNALWAGTRPLQCSPETCPLTRMADVMIYAPDVARWDAAGERRLVAAESARAHPHVPLILASPEPIEPRALAELKALVPEAQLAAEFGPDPFTGFSLEDQVHWLLKTNPGAETCCLEGMATAGRPA